MKRSMKRVAAAATAMVLSASMVMPGMSVQAAYLPEAEGVVAQFGTPLVDGVVDDVWNEANMYKMVQPGEISSAQGQVRMLWDDNALYVLAEVFDENLDDASANSYEQDSVEVFLDEMYDKASSYGSDDVHYRVSYLNNRTADNGSIGRWYTATGLFDGQEVSVSGNGSVSGNAALGEETPYSGKGYVVEACIKWEKTNAIPQNGREYGFDVQVNAAEGGSRKGTISLFDATGNAYQNPTLFGKLTLQGRDADRTSGAFPYGLMTYIEEIEKINLDVYVNGEDTKALVNEAKAMLESGSYTQAQIDEYYQKLEAAMHNLNDGSGYTSPYDLPYVESLPDVFTFENGTKVNSADDWEKRADEIKAAYDYYMYGPMPDTSGEEVSYQINNLREEAVNITDPVSGENKSVTLKKADFVITVSNEKGTGSFNTVLTLPTVEAPTGGYPIFSEMSGWASDNANYAASRGYAAVSWSPTDIASDDANRTGLFYTLYPYGDSYKEQTGALVAWGWGAGKILDALYNGAAEELNINTDNNILTGVSRYGKATAVAGAYDERIKVVMPACSGAGGLACFRYSSEGKTYDLTSAGFYQNGTSMYTTGDNEPLGSLQSTSEAHWFNDNFLKFSSEQQLPFDQHYLAALMADSDRYLFVVAGHNAEDWTNPAGMAMTYLATREVYDYLGLRDHLIINIHESNAQTSWWNSNPNHAVLLEDMVYLLDYCDIKLYGKSESEVSSDLREIKTTAFFDDVNWDPAFDAYVSDELTSVDWERLVKKPATVENGATEEEIIAALPKVVNVYVDEARYRKASVEWDVANIDYDSSLKVAQTLEFDGIITLPEGVTNPNNISLAVKAAVVVNEKDDPVKYANIVVDGISESAWENATVYTTEKLLDSATDSTDGTASIRFMWDDAYLYILADVKDSDVYTDTDSNEEEDSITFTLAKNKEAGNEVSNYVVTADGATLKIGWTGAFDWGTWGVTTYKEYTSADELYAKTAKTADGWQMEACIAWEDLGIEAANGGEFALEAIVNNCSTAKTGLEYRKAMFLKSYPENMESLNVDFWGMTLEGQYNAGLYAENLVPFKLGEKNTTDVAENIGRYDLIKALESFEELHVAPYPIKTSFDANVLAEANAYALSAEADKEGIEKWQQKLTEMMEQIQADNHYGKMMAKYGTPMVDGNVEDAVWDSAYTYKTTATADGQYAEIRTLWDEKALYVQTKVFDSKYDVAGTQPHEQDSVEFFFMEAEDAAQNSFGKNGGQWRINRDNWTTVTFGPNEPFYGVVTELEDGTGYVVEARIAFAEGMDTKALDVMNFDICINICENGGRTGAIAWTSTDCYTNPRTSGQLVYLEDAAEGATLEASYDPYALLKVLNKALKMESEDYDAKDFAAHYNYDKLKKYYDEAVSGQLTEKQIEKYYNDVIKMMSKITYDGEHMSALGFEANHNFPDTFTMEDGKKVTNKEMWEERRAEIKDLYEFYMYGKLPVPEETGLTQSFSANEDGSEYTVTLKRDELEKSFTFNLYLPEGTVPEGGWPYIINYGGNIDGAQAAGYAVIGFGNHSNVADGSNYQGIFYELYPECKGNETVTGVGPLAGRAWGVGRILDCVEEGVGELSKLNPKNSVITGFSYLGKTALVTGALEDRIAITNPQHSGIGGAALFRWSSQGKFYSNDEYNLGKDWLMTKQEPVGQVQGQGAAWVKTVFSDFLGGDNVPFESYMLMSLVAPRGLYVSAGYYDQGTDPEAMYGAYLNAQDTYDLLGCKENIAYGAFPTEHAMSSDEWNGLFAFCDNYFYGKELGEDFYQTVYDNSPDRPEYDVISIPTVEDTEKPEDKPTGDDKPAPGDKPAGDNKPSQGDKPAGDNKPSQGDKPAGNNKPVQDNKPGGNNHSSNGNSSSGNNNSSNGNHSGRNNHSANSNKSVGNNHSAKQVRTEMISEVADNNSNVVSDAQTVESDVAQVEENVIAEQKAEVVTDKQEDTEKVQISEETVPVVDADAVIELEETGTKKNLIMIFVALAGVLAALGVVGVFLKINKED